MSASAGFALAEEVQAVGIGAVEGEGLSVVVCNTGVRHELVAGEYNTLRRHCESAARALGVKSLRAVDPPLLAANKHKLNLRDYECASHIAGENQRVLFGVRALRAGDFAQVGQYMFQSHESSRDLFRNSCPEPDVLVELARAHPGCLGARLTGGGFGGATINLVARAHADAFRAAIATAGEQRTGRPIATMICQVVDGAG